MNRVNGITSPGCDCSDKGVDISIIGSGCQLFRMLLESGCLSSITNTNLRRLAMGRKTFISLLVMVLCLGWVFSTTAIAQDLGWLPQDRQVWFPTGPYKLLDTPDIREQMKIARELAGGDKYLFITQRLQCHDIDDTFTVHRNASWNAEVSPPPTKVFDNVYFVGNVSTGGWLIDTGDGYILLDAMYGNSPEKEIIPGMQKLGLDPSKIKYILITHAGPDHAGGAAYFQSKYGTHVIMDKASWEALLNPAPDSWLVRLAYLRATGQFDKIPAPEKDWVGPPQRDMEGADGQKLTLGDTTITMVFTPRTVNGAGLSYFIPVKIKGKKHMWATYGNTNVRWHYSR